MRKLQRNEKTSITARAESRKIESQRESKNIRYVQNIFLQCSKWKEWFEGKEQYTPYVTRMLTDKVLGTRETGTSESILSLANRSKHLLQVVKENSDERKFRCRDVSIATIYKKEFYFPF